MALKTLKEIHDKILNIAKHSSPVIVQKGELYRWKGTITSFLMGELEFRCFPYFGPVFSDSSITIPCITVDPIKNSLKLITLCNNTVLLNEPEFVVEVFVINSQQFNLVHLLLNAEKLKVIERNLQVFTLKLKSTKSSSSVTDHSTKSECSEKIIPLRISSVIASPQSDVICLVLIMLVNQPSQKHLWLILRNKEVIWKDLLIPNKLFVIRFPADGSPNPLRAPASLYNYFDSRWDISFQQMLHHKEWMKTYAYSFLPLKCKITSCSEKIELNEKAEKWLDITDNHLKSLTLASVYGVIKNINYLNAWKSFNCSWCDKFDNILEQTLPQDHQEENEIEENIDFLNNRWSSPTTLDKQICELEFPEVDYNKTEENQLSGFGIRGGKLTIQITLQKKYSDNVSYVFLKRWIASQYPAGLIPGVSVCFSNVTVKRSKRKFCYFISTPFTRVHHLETSCIENFTVPQYWGRFAFPFIRKCSQKIWGVLDLDLLTKVSISAKCKSCNEPFVQYQCSNAFCVNSKLMLNAEYTVVALASLFVRTSNGDACSLFLKNENVRTYLKIPERIWKKLCSLSALTELFYLYQTNEFEDENVDFPNILFRRYCKYFRPKTRFHVCCRPFKDSDNRYFCIELTEISHSRVTAIRNTINAKVSSKSSS